jgi:hypothetical protein
MHTTDGLGYLGSYVSEVSALGDEKTYEVNTSQRYVRGSHNISVMENAFKGTHDTSEALNACSQLLQHNDHIAFINNACDSRGYII